MLIDMLLAIILLILPNFIFSIPAWIAFRIKKQELDKKYRNYWMFASWFLSLVFLYVMTSYSAAIFEYYADSFHHYPGADTAPLLFQDYMIQKMIEVPVTDLLLFILASSPSALFVWLYARRLAVMQLTDS